MGERDLEGLERVVLLFLLVGDFSNDVELLLPSGASKLVGFRDATFRFWIVLIFVRRCLQWKCVLIDHTIEYIYIDYLFVMCMLLFHKIFLIDRSFERIRYNISIIL